MWRSVSDERAFARGLSESQQEYQREKYRMEEAQRERDALNNWNRRPNRRNDH